MIDKSKKIIMGIFFMLIMTLISTGIYSSKAEAASSVYNTTWEKLYSTPNAQNKYGRCWYGKRNSNTYFFVCLDSYYTYGSSAKIQYYYKVKGATKSVTKSTSSYSGDSSVTYKKSVSGTFKKVRFYASAHGITVDKTYTN